MNIARYTPFLLTFLLSISGYSSAPTCKSLFSSPTQDTQAAAPESAKNLESYEQIFTRSRGLSSYNVALGPNFTKALERLSKKGGHWLDAGAGEAIAVRQWLDANKSSGLSATVISLESSAESKDRLLVLKGRFMESIPSSEIQQSDLITDVFGPLAYSGHPHLVLQKYFDSLKDDGEILIFLGHRDEIYGRTNRFITQDGRYLSLTEWVQTIPGIRAELIKDSQDDDGVTIEKWCFRLTKNSAQSLAIPEVELKELKSGAPPRMLFQETAPVHDRLQSRIEKVKALTKSLIETQIQKTNFTQFMNSFRAGEITHPLVREIKGLSEQEAWVNVSNFGSNIVQDIQKKAFNAKDTSVFWGLAQKWIRFRINRINPDNFRYVNIESLATLDIPNKTKLITDFYGDFVGELAPDRVLNKYCDILSESGSIFIYLGPDYTGFGSTSEVLTKAGTRMNIKTWLKSIDGLDVQEFRGGYAYAGGAWTFVKITKNSKALKIPRLRFLGAEDQAEGDLPRMIFAEE